MTSFGLAATADELGKVRALLRRDFLITWSYRAVFVSDVLSLVGQVLVFAFVSKMIDPAVVPQYGDRPSSYLSFVTIGIALSAFLHVGLTRMTSALRGEQVQGTLESLLMTPTRLATLQLGWVAYDLLYVPARTVAFLAVVAVALSVHFELGGMLPALVLIVAFIPFVWGLGIAGAAGVLTFRRGGGLFGFAAAGLTFASGAYFPLDLLPDWLVRIAELNPIAIAVEGVREALLGGAGWSALWRQVAVLVPMSAASLLVGMVAFRWALRRELRSGTLGLY